MLEGSLTFTLVSLVAGILCLSLGLYVYIRNPTFGSTKAFLVTMLLEAVTAMGIFAMANASNPGTAELLGRVVATLSVLVGASFIIMVAYVPVERKNCWARRNVVLFSLIVLAVALTPALLDYSVHVDEYGYWFSSTPELFVYYIMNLGVLAIPATIMMFIYVSSTDSTVKRNAVLIAIGVLLPIITIILDLVLTQSGYIIPHILALGYLLTGIIFAVSQFRYRIFVVEPVIEDVFKKHAEEERRETLRVDVVGGHCDLVKSKRSDPAYRIFVEEVASGKNGLVITRAHPDRVREKYGLMKTPILWLSGQPGPERVDPGSLSILQHTIMDFLQKDPSSVILLDGLEYLMAENSMDKVLRFIYAVHDAVVVSASKFIIPIDPDVMELKDLALIEKEFNVIEAANWATIQEEAAA